MNEMINSLRYDRMSSFHERFRTADALLVDDIQTLGSRERTQEEFFHTFNTLHSMQKQIVISCDRPPKEVPGLVDRLRSRFEWGLMADIQPPDLETKMVDPRPQGRGSSGQPARRRPDLHGDADEVQHPRAGRRSDPCHRDRLRLARRDQPFVDGQTGAALDRGIESAQGHASTRIQRAVGEEFQLKLGQLREKNNARAVAYPAPDRHVPVQRADWRPRCRRSAGPSTASTTPPCSTP